MRRLIARAAIITLVLVALVSTAVFVGRQQPPSRAISMLHLNDCELPCWIGITPGKTTLAEGRNRIQKFFGDTTKYTLNDHLPDFTVYSQLDSPLYVIRFYPYNGQPNTVIESIAIRIVPLEFQPSVGDFVVFLGTPNDVYAPSGFSELDSLSFKEPPIDLNIRRLQCNAVMPDQKVSGMTFFASNLPFPELGLYQWRGFKTCYSGF